MERKTSSYFLQGLSYSFYTELLRELLLINYFWGRGKSAWVSCYFFTHLKFTFFPIITRTKTEMTDFPEIKLGNFILQGRGRGTRPHKHLPINFSPSNLLFFYFVCLIIMHLSWILFTFYKLSCIYCLLCSHTNQHWTIRPVPLCSITRIVGAIFITEVLNIHNRI